MFYLCRHGDCVDCLCLHAISSLYSPKQLPSCPPALLSWVGDGACDDVTNTGDCFYDGGDCCGSEMSKGVCLECQCKSQTEEKDDCPPEFADWVRFGSSKKAHIVMFANVEGGRRYL